jgi:hypothetical protein
MTTSTPVFADVTADPRLAIRRSIRERLAARDLLRADRREIENAIRNLDQELDGSTNRHQATCEPIQREISELERRRSSLIADRKDVPTSIDVRRRELLDLLRDANGELEIAANDHKERTAVLQKEIKAILESEKRYSDLNEHSLAHPSVANPHLLDLHWAAKRGCEFGLARVEAAREKVAQYASQIAAEKTPRAAPLTTSNPSGIARVNQSAIGEYERRLRRWRLELRAAEKMLGDARAESETIRQAILDE